MKILTLKRTAKSDYAVYGTYIHENKPICQSLELPWLDNKQEVSCIPGDTYYYVTPIISPSHGEVYLINNVPGRTNVLIHKGNTDDDTLGCQLPGLYNGWIWSKDSKINEWGVSGSKTGLERIEKIFGREEPFWLVIKNVWD